MFNKKGLVPNPLNSVGDALKQKLAMKRQKLSQDLQDRAKNMLGGNPNEQTIAMEKKLTEFGFKR